MSHDVIVVGGSYAGMAAALQLLRARRRVLIIDAGQRRNRFAAHSHGFLGQDGKDPALLHREARAQLMAYPTLTWIEGEAVETTPLDEGHAVTLSDGSRHEGRRILLATGLADDLPGIPGLAERWGQSVFHCPYCHGYELNGAPAGVIASNEMGLHQALMLPDWGPTTLFLNGAFTPDAEARAALERRGTRWVTGRVVAIEGEAEVVLEGGGRHAMAGLFVAPSPRPASPLPERMGCEMQETPMGRLIRVDEMKRTTMPHVYACGDVAHVPHSLALAVGDGSMAGAMVHRSLIFPEG